jgi:hypothetical protein|tara:strand:- start:4477 stop:4989 length:513 start_codon:yes stop_codon:yes gene_type:complete
MTDENQLSPDEVSKLRELIDVEEIKKLRLKYSYCMDARELDQLMEVFADGAVCGYGPYGDWVGKDTIYNNYKETFKDTLETPFVSMHVNTNHLVEITGPDTAKGRVYLIDLITKNMDGTDLEDGQSNILWLALYDEEYVKIDGEWKVKVMNLHFFWPERHVPKEFIAKFL